MRRLLLVCAALLACESSTAMSMDATLGDASDVSAAFDGDGGAEGRFVAEALVSQEPERSFPEPEVVLRPGRDYRAVIETDVGSLTVDLFEEDAPVAVNSFVFLALHRFYDGLAFHSVIDGVTAETGDPSTVVNDRNRWGTGGPGYSYETETTPAQGFDDRGVVGVSRGASRNSNGSRFFFTLAPMPTFNGQYTVLGRVIEGLDVLDALARNPNILTAPATPSRVRSVTILRR